MRFSVLLAGLVTSLAFTSPALADSQSDLDRCKLAGEVSKADEGIAACDRIINDPKVTAPNRAAALRSRCGWWWTKQASDRALSACTEATRIDSRSAPAYINRGHAYVLKSVVDHAFADFSEAIRLDPKNAWAYTERGNLYKNKGDFEHAPAALKKRFGLTPTHARVFLA